jgi:hypothetical protein
VEVIAPPRVRPRRPQCTPSAAVTALAAVTGLTGIAGASSAARAQQGAPTVGQPLAYDWSTTALVTLGSGAEERARLGQLLGRDSTAGFLLRTASVLTAPAVARDGRIAAAGVLPEMLVVRNSALATPELDGTLWSGRGTNLLVRGGITLRTGRFTAALVPEIAYSQNRGFQSTPSTLNGQRPLTGPFAAPWFTGAYSADLPIRFGDQGYTIIGLGQSHVTYSARHVAVGLSTENQWWGPGVRNALLLSNAAEGIPHAFVRTVRPVGTPVGQVEARWILGGLTPSLYFATPTDTPDGRALNGAIATLRVAADPNLTVGVARLVLTPTRGTGAILRHALDVVTRNESLGTGDTLTTDARSDQLTSVFGRWVFPGVGAEVYGEFARVELPRSVRDFLLAPLNTGGYTFGLARAWRGPAAGTVRTGLEVTNIEQVRTFSDRPPPPDFYTGRAAPAGFTNRGQPLGAAIGPGSQSQWAAVDYYGRAWQVGVFAQRIRHQNDALYRVFVPNAFRHDVSLTGGLRAGLRQRGLDARATLAVTERLNYLFQGGSFNFLGIGTVDVRNVSLAVSLSPTLRTPR